MCLAKPTYANTAPYRLTASDQLASHLINTDSPFPCSSCPLGSLRPQPDRPSCHVPACSYAPLFELTIRGLSLLPPSHQAHTDTPARFCPHRTVPGPTYLSTSVQPSPTPTVHSHPAPTPRTGPVRTVPTRLRYLVQISSAPTRRIEPALHYPNPTDDSHHNEPLHRQSDGPIFLPTSPARSTLL